MSITYRSEKGSALTLTELDDNFRYFTGSHAITGSLEVSQNITASNFVGTLQGTASFALTSSVALANDAVTAATASSLIDGVTFHGAISSSLIPAGPYTDNTSSYDLGSSTAAWKDLYLSNGTIYMLAAGGNGSISFDDTTNTFLFTDPDGNVTTQHQGGITDGAAQNYIGTDYGTSLYFTGSNFRRTNLAVITRAEYTAIALPEAGNYAPGTVVEFDIIASTGSAWQLQTVNSSGNLTNGFVQGRNPNYSAPADATDYQDFNPFWNNATTTPVFANLSSYYPQTVSGNYASGSALIRLVAMQTFAQSNNTTTISGSAAWFGRIVDRTFYN